MPLGIGRYSTTAGPRSPTEPALPHADDDDHDQAASIAFVPPGRRDWWSTNWLGKNVFVLLFYGTDLLILAVIGVVYGALIFGIFCAASSVLLFVLAAIGWAQRDASDREVRETNYRLAVLFRLAYALLISGLLIGSWLVFRSTGAKGGAPVLVAISVLGGAAAVYQLVTAVRDGIRGLRS